MRWTVCSVFDTKVGAYMQPFFSRSRAEALRSFEDACSDEKTQFRRHAADFRLFVLGEFDDAVGVFACLDQPMILVGADELVAQKEDLRGNGFKEHPLMGSPAGRPG